MEKRGMSSIVTTLIIIVLSIVALGVVWGVVRAILQDSSDNIPLDSLTLDLNIVGAYKSEGNVTVVVERNAGQGSFQSINFVFFDGANSETVVQDASDFQELDTRMFYLSLKKLNSSLVQRVSIAPSVQNGGRTKVGSIMDIYYLANSTGGTGGVGGGIGPDGTCTPEALFISCGTWDCGNRANNCGTIVNCGSCETGTICDTGRCVPGECTAESPTETCDGDTCGMKINNCDNLVICGSCETGTICDTGRCVPGECTAESPTETCDGDTCGIKLNNCDSSVNCGTCVSGSVCEAGKCNKITFLTSGIVEETWPGDSGLYFGSSNLSTNTSYYGKYVRLPEGEETDCLLIASYRFPVEGYSKSHIAFNFPTDISVGEHYYIFDSLSICQVYVF